MKKLFLCLLLFSAAAVAFAQEDDLSITPGGGSFFALRHHREGGVYLEVIGSPIALQRAYNQAEKGKYKLDVAGPFDWHTDAARYIRANWDPKFGGPRKRKRW